MWQFNQKHSRLKAQFFISYGFFRSRIQTGPGTACLRSTMPGASAGKTSVLGEIQWWGTKIVWGNPHSQIWPVMLEAQPGCWWDLSPFGLCSLMARCQGSKKHLPKRTRQIYFLWPALGSHMMLLPLQSQAHPDSGEGDTKPLNGKHPCHVVGGTCGMGDHEASSS